MRPDIDTIAETCIAVRVRLLNRVITSLYDNAFRPLRVKISQLNILIVTAKLGLAQPAKVCEILQLDISTLSRNVERMKASGWLETVSGPDARTQSFRLTSEGKKLIDKAIPIWEKAQGEAARLLGVDGVSALGTVTKKLFGAKSG